MSGPVCRSTRCLPTSRPCWCEISLTGCTPGWPLGSSCAARTPDRCPSARSQPSRYGSPGRCNSLPAGSPVAASARNCAPPPGCPPSRPGSDARVGAGVYPCVRRILLLDRVEGGCDLVEGRGGGGEPLPGQGLEHHADHGLAVE